MTFLWLAAYAFVIAKAGEVLRRPVIRRWIEGVTGTLLVALGVRIAAETDASSRRRPRGIMMGAR